MAHRRMLTEDQISQLFEPPIEQRALIRHYTLASSDLALIRRGRGDHHRLSTSRPCRPVQIRPSSKSKCQSVSRSSTPLSPTSPRAPSSQRRSTGIRMRFSFNPHFHTVCLINAPRHHP